MNYKRKKSRIKSNASKQFPGGSRRGEAPSHWNILFHSRPRRRNNKANCHKLLVNTPDSDAMIWALGNRKPHNYYW